MRPHAPHGSLALLVLVALQGAAVAHAQDAATTATTERAEATAARASRPAPPIRVDVEAPIVGLGAASADPHGTMLFWGAGLSVVEPGGNGVRVTVTRFTTSLGDGLLGPTSARVEGDVVDVGYVRRIRLAGDDRLGLGLDLTGGLTVAHMSFEQPTSGWCWSSCGPTPNVDEHFADGWQAGTHVGGSLDGRIYGFTLGLQVRAHAYVGLRPQAGDDLVQGDVTASAYFGFGFY
ncbi:MAG: hypothetical protein U0234_09830 [Sandaracinus sp.]